MDILDADALRRLFPEAFWQPFIEQGSRPDGRPSGQSRPASIGLGAVANATSSALVKLGNTAVLAATQVEIMQPLPERPDEGCLEVSFEMPAVCSPDVVPGRPGEDVHIISKQLQSLLTRGPCADLKELKILSKTSAWAVYLDVVCIDADGSVLDAALLASAAALMSLELPALRRNKDGRLVAEESSEAEGASDGPAEGQAGEDTDMDAATEPSAGGRRKGKKAFSVKRRKPALLRSVPVAQTISVHGKDLLVDPTAEEERLWGGSNTITMVLDSASLQDESPRVLGVFKMGGSTTASLVTLHDCIAAAQANAKEKYEALTEALAPEE